MENSTYPNEGIRLFERKPHTEDIEYTVEVLELNELRILNLKARAIDISDGGLCIETDYPLSPGHTLLFNGGVEHKTGIVRWSRKINGYYRVGVEVIEKNESTLLNVAEKENALYIAEEREKYTKLLAKAIERFNKELRDIEKRCYESNQNPEEILKLTQKAIDEVISKCEEFEKGIKDREIIRSARVEFHEKTNSILSKSYCINRCRTWPQGQQGDYKTLELAYRNTPLSDGIGYYLDLCLLNTPLAEAVRNRIKKLEEMLREEISKRKQPSLLNIACGSCRELMGIVPEIRDSGAKIICIDNDNDALSFAQDRLSYAGILPQVELRKYNALRMFDDEMNMMEFGKQDIIYSVGLFDYLPDDFLIKLLRALYNLLNPGGKLIAAFKDAKRYRAQDFHWIVDWDGFLQRTQDDFERLFQQAGIPDNALSMSREKTDVIIFYTVTK
jgi:SAM-dependent methyltransferase